MSEDNNNQPAKPATGNIKTTLLWCLVLIAGGVAAVFLIFNTEPVAEREGAVRQTAMLVDVTTAEHGSFRPSITAMGTVTPAREVTVSPRVAGHIVLMDDAFQPGGEVQQGQRLVQLDDADYLATLRQRQSELDQALADLEMEKGRQQQAEAEYRAFNETLSPERRALVLREPQLRAAEARVDAARAALQQAELNLARTEVTAPFHAQVVERTVNLGSQVDAGTALGRLVGVDTFWVEVTVPVARLPWLTFPDAEGDEGSPVSIRNRSAWPKSVTRSGQLYRLVGELDSQTRMARLLVNVSNPLGDKNDPQESRRLIVGEYVQCQITGRPIENALRVSRDVVRGGDTLWIMGENGELEIRPVEIEFRDDEYAYIRGGLSADEAIVSSRLATVEDGVLLRTGDAPAPSAVEDQMP